jgi:hypothetical protein
MEPQPAQKTSDGDDLLVISQALGAIRDSFVELSLELKDALFQLDTELRDETSWQLRGVLDQLQGRKPEP